MLATIKQQWLDALRSGDYQQGKEALRTLPDEPEDTDGSMPVRFCCLGVLCDLYAKEHPKARWDEENNFDPGGSLDDDVRADVLPAQVQQWAGLDSDDPWVPDAYAMKAPLSRINDDSGASFEEIATLIERSL